jgi:branched-chain amino acid transport system substrate-binding protein
LRHPRIAATVLVALAAALAGCGGSGVVEGGNNFQGTLTVYSDLPLQGPQDALMTSMVNGEKLALYDAGGHVGHRHVSFVSLNDSQQTAGGWTPAQTAGEAAQAALDLSTIAYIGDFDSGATATSLPLTNANDILQVSPASPYVGLTDASSVDINGNPLSYYPVGARTFARLMPSDVQEAAATTQFMHSLGVKRLYVLTDVAPFDAPFDSAIAPLVADDTSPQRSITLVGQQQIDTETNTQPVGYAQIAAAVAATDPDGVLVGASPDQGAEALWQELHSALPHTKLFAPSTLATGPFLATLGGAASSTYVTSPILELSQYPRSAQRVLRAYRRRFGIAPTAYSLYGFEAMESVLAAIHAAGKDGSNRLDVVSAYFHLGERNSVIGRYRIDSDGDTSLSRFAGYRVGRGGRLIELRLLSGALSVSSSASSSSG